MNELDTACDVTSVTENNNNNRTLCALALCFADTLLDAGPAVILCKKKRTISDKGREKVNNCNGKPLGDFGDD